MGREAQLTEAEQVELVLQELKKARAEGTTVLGRVLNPVNKGYAVGIGGLVCFLPVTQCLYEVPHPCCSSSTKSGLNTLFAGCHCIQHLQHNRCRHATSTHAVAVLKILYF